MAKELMNEAERFLLTRWQEARRLEESLRTVRTKYKEVFERIREAVTEAHPELDASEVKVTQFFNDGIIVFGRKAWLKHEAFFIPGFWVENIRIEILTSEESNSPLATLVIPMKAAKLAGINLAAARKAVMAEAKQLLPLEEWKEATQVDGEESLLRFPAPSKAELLDLLHLGDGQGFVQRFVELFDIMARFIPVVDRLYASRSIKAAEP